MKKISLKKLKTFHDRMCLFFEENGYLKSSENEYSVKYTTTTPYGRLDITLFKESDPSYAYAVFSKFREPGRVPKHFGHNQYSGKYNILIGSQVELEDAVVQAECHFGLAG